ncbi:PAS domain S-box-containing protein [Hoeflea marina]|uniref:Sensor protein FixL n=1 Tax=Hoeflea marina TaxID=274592 RepID=A0A317PL87_9HYPH|nr:CHASE domain-containing protein [Hoeflea marina]PWW01715.1 PAS domain S-box-containing protein [Hoeflea marina]
MVQIGEMPGRTRPGGTLNRLSIAMMAFLLIPLGLTYYAWKVSSDATNEKEGVQFESLALESKKALLSRIGSYENALLGGTAYFQGSDYVSRDEWRRYVNTLNIGTNLPGITGLGKISSLRDDEIAGFLSSIRAEGAPNFEIHPKGVAGGNYVVTYNEPELANRQAIGLNVAFEAHRKQAAELARDTGKPAITKRIILVQDEEKTPGFLLMYPIYRDQPDSVSAQAPSAFDGWVYATFIARNFMKELTKSQGNTINLRIYDGRSENPEALIYDSNVLYADGYKALFEKREHLDVMQQKWLVIWESTRGFEQRWQSSTPLFILAGGLLVTFFLGLFLLVAKVREARVDENRPGAKALALPALAFVVLAAGSAWLYRALDEKEINYVHTLISSETNKIDLLIAAETKGKISALKRMSGRMEADADMPDALWQADARKYLKDLKGLRALAWVGPGGNLLQVAQSSSNERTIWIDAILSQPQRDLALDAVRRTIPKASLPIRLSNGESAFVTYLPFDTDGQPGSYLAVIFSVGELFSSHILAETLERYRFMVTFNDEKEFEFGNLAQPVAGGWSLDRPIQILDKLWTIRTTPTEPFLKSHRTLLPDSALISGFLIALLSAVAAHMTFVSRMKTTHLERSTDRIRQEAIRNSTVLNTVSEGVLTINASGVIESINPAGLRLFGFTLEELVGQNIKMLMPQPYRSGHDGFLGQYLKTGTRKVIGIGRQVSAMRKDGSVFPIDLSVNEMMLDGTRLFVGTIRDTSEAVVAAQALREASMLRAAILASTENMIVATDMGGKVIVFNDAAAGTLGYFPDQVIGLETPVLWHEPQEIIDRARTLASELDDAIEPGFQTLISKVDAIGVDENEWTCIRKDGSRLPVQSTVTSLHNEAHETTGYLFVMVDLTKRKEVERMKSEFVSIVNHELRTPLTSIRGALGLITGSMSGALPEKANHLINIARNNCERLTLLINDILDIDKIASGQMRFDVKREALEPLLMQAIEANEPYAEKLGVKIRATEIDSDLLVNVDQVRLAQVMANLLSNAAKFSHKGGQVEVSASRMQQQRVRISVKDQGAGIDPSFRTRIFGKFSQGDGSSTRVKGGSGLGLHISKQIVDQMGGAIGFESEVGHGATFWVDFPLAAADSLTDATESGQPAPVLLHVRQTEAPTLLHVEDDEDLSGILALSLQGKIDLVTAPTLKDAESLLADQRFDLIVLDIEFAEGSGFDLLRTLAERAGPPIPVMILSASEMSEEVGKSVASALVKSRVSEATIVSEIERLVAG